MTTRPRRLMALRTVGDLQRCCESYPKYIDLTWCRLQSTFLKQCTRNERALHFHSDLIFGAQRQGVAVRLLRRRIHPSDWRVGREVQSFQSWPCKPRSTPCLRMDENLDSLSVLLKEINPQRHLPHSGMSLSGLRGCWAASLCWWFRWPGHSVSQPHGETH